jgi:hypothetical protein
MLDWQGSDALARNCGSTRQMEAVFHADVWGATHELQPQSDAGLTDRHETNVTSRNCRCQDFR